MADDLAKAATSQKPDRTPVVSISWLKRQTRGQKLKEWKEWYEQQKQPKTYKSLHLKQLDIAYTNTTRKISSAILGLRTGHGCFLDYLSKTNSEKYPSPRCTSPMQPPQTPKHSILGCPKYQVQRNKLRRELKLHRNHPVPLQVILHSPAGTKALTTMISTNKIATAEWIQVQVSNAPAMEDDPEGRRIGWGTLIESENEHEGVRSE